MGAKPGIQCVQGFKQGVNSLFVGFLSGCKPRLVYTVVDAVVDLTVQRVDLTAQQLRVVIPWGGTNLIKGGVQDADDLR